MNDPLISQHRIDAYLLGLLSPAEQRWIESCFDSDVTVQELFRHRQALPFHLQPDPELFAAEPAFDSPENVDFPELLRQIDAELLAVAGITIPARPTAPVPARQTPDFAAPVLAYRRQVPTQIPANTSSRAAGATTLSTAPQNSANTASPTNWAEFEWLPAENPAKVRIFLAGPMAGSEVVKVTIRDENLPQRPVLVDEQEFTVCKSTDLQSYVDIPLTYSDEIDLSVRVIPVPPAPHNLSTESSAT